MNVLIILAALASGGLCHLDAQLPAGHQPQGQQTVYIQESTAPPKTVTQYTSSPAAAGAGARLSYPTFTAPVRNFGSAKTVTSFPSFGSYSGSYQWPTAQQTFSKPSSPTYSTPATPTPTVSTFSSSSPAYVTPTTAASYPAYSAFASSVYSTPATVTTTFPSASAFKSTFAPDYNIFASPSPQLYRDLSRPVVTQFSSPGRTSQGISRSFSNLKSPVTIQKSTTFAPVKPTLSAYADAVTLYPLSGQYNTAVKSLGSQFSTQQAQHSPVIEVVGTTVHIKPAYNSYASVPVAYAPAGNWASYPTVQSVRQAPASYRYAVPAVSLGGQWSGSSHLSPSAYSAQPSAFTYTLQGAPLTREYHTLEAPHVHSWSSRPFAQQHHVL